MIHSMKELCGNVKQMFKDYIQTKKKIFQFRKEENELINELGGIESLFRWVLKRLRRV